MKINNLKLFSCFFLFRIKVEKKLFSFLKIFRFQLINLIEVHYRRKQASANCFAETAVKIFFSLNRLSMFDFNQINLLEYANPDLFVQQFQSR